MHNSLQKITTPTEFASAWRQTIGGFITDKLIPLAEQFVKMVDANPTAREELLELGISRSLQAQLDRLGRGQLIPELIFGAVKPSVVNQLMHLPIDMQREAFQNGIEVLQPDCSDTRRIPISEISTEQLTQAVDREGFIPVVKQRTIIEKRAANKARTFSAPAPYTLHKGSLQVHVPYTFTVQDLLDLLPKIAK